MNLKGPLQISLLGFSRWLLIMLVVSLHCHVAEAASEQSFTRLIGRMIRAGAREIADISDHVSKPKGESVEMVLIDLRSQWRHFSWPQKKEFILISLTKCDIQGGAATLLMQVIGKDGIQLQNELNAIPDRVLMDRIRLTKEEVVSFRAILARLAGI